MSAPAPARTETRATIGTLARRVGAELLGTGMLVTVVVGSGVAAQRLSSDTGLQLLENSIATAFGARRTVWFALIAYALAGAAMLAVSWPGPLAALLALPYLATVWPFRAVTDATASTATRGWDRFLWLNQFAGFAVTLLLIWYALIR